MHHNFRDSKEMSELVENELAEGCGQMQAWVLEGIYNIRMSCVRQVQAV